MQFGLRSIAVKNMTNFAAGIRKEQVIEALKKNQACCGTSTRRTSEIQIAISNQCLCCNRESNLALQTGCSFSLSTLWDYFRDDGSRKLQCRPLRCGKTIESIDEWIDGPG
jgi:hypothetical protein